MKATDIDSGRFGTVRYTKLHGVHANAFVLDQLSGMITVGSGTLLDREVSPGKLYEKCFNHIQEHWILLSGTEISLTIEARDTEGTGRSSTVPLIIHLLDVNDNAPQFVGLPYETNLTPDLSRFTSKVVVQVFHLSNLS